MSHADAIVRGSTSASVERGRERRQSRAARSDRHVKLDADVVDGRDAGDGAAGDARAARRHARACRSRRRPTPLPDGGGKLRGGIEVALQPKLSDGLPGVRRCFERYPYSCLEQQSFESRSACATPRTGRRWSAQHAVVSGQRRPRELLPAARRRPRTGSDASTAYLLASATRRRSGPRLRAARRHARRAWTAGSIGFVEGRIKRDFWAPPQRISTCASSPRSRRCRATARRSRACSARSPIAPNQWPTSRGDRLAAHPRRASTAIPDRDDKRVARPSRSCARGCTYAGHAPELLHRARRHLVVAHDQRRRRTPRALTLAVLDAPGWKDDMPRLVGGSLARQQNGAWQTTIANRGARSRSSSSRRSSRAMPVARQTRRASACRARRDVDWAQTPPAAHAAGGSPASPSRQRPTPCTSTQDGTRQAVGDGAKSRRPSR